MRQRLAGKGDPTCFPVPLAKGPARPRRARPLYPCLSLQITDRVVGSDVSADGTRLIVDTGANQGGKSTFLRSVGVAQMMRQCGMFTAAEEFSASPAGCLPARWSALLDRGIRVIVVPTCSTWRSLLPETRGGHPFLARAAAG